MNSQVVQAEIDRKYHRLLWRDLDSTRPVDAYEGVRLTFGDKASPYLAQFVLRSHAQDFKENYPAAAMVLLRDMYIDDILHSEETVQKWCRNRTEVLEEIPQEGRATGVKHQPVFLHETRSVK